MNFCRICLSTDIYGEISQLQLNNSDEKLNFTVVIEFCLNLQIHKISKITFICEECYKQVVSFYKFKKLALQNDEYLKSLEQDNDEVVVDFEVEDLKHEKCDHRLEIKREPDSIILQIKEEPVLGSADIHIDSDDEVLSVVKQHKDTNVIAEKRKRGRPKKVKTDIKEDLFPKKVKQVCEECGKSVNNLREHSLLHKPKGERKRIPCKVCPTTFSSYSGQYKHFKRKHLGLKYQCKVCNKAVSSLRNHMLIIHNREKLPLVCVSCHKRFITQSVLDAHMRTHTKDRPFQCDACEKKFKTKVLMDSHKRQVHDQEKSHLCQYCSKSFFKKYHLQIHLRSHTKEKPYKCDECEKHFQSSTNLTIHKRIHTGVKNHACTFCEMAFSTRGALSTHMISHTKVKKYPCQYCGVSFGRSDHRNRHERTAHLRHMIT